MAVGHQVEMQLHFWHDSSRIGLLAFWDSMADDKRWILLRIIDFKLEPVKPPRKHTKAGSGHIKPADNPLFFFGVSDEEESEDEENIETQE